MRKVERAPTFQEIFESKSHKGPYSREDVELARDFNKRYLHWDELKFKTDDEEHRRKIWALMKILRAQDYRAVTIGKEKYLYSVMPQFMESLHFIDTHAAGYTTVEGEPIGQKEANRYVISSLMEEAISSSQLEGAAVTRLDAKKMLREGRKPKTRDEAMILNNYRTMEHIKTVSNEKLTPDLIRSMHKMITDGTLDPDREWEGRYRESDDVVVGDPLDEDNVYHVPPPYDEIPALVEGLCEFANRNEGEFIHPILKGIVIHFMIGYIHPFVDGNGRLARSLFYWHSIKNGYWIMEYAAVSKAIKARRKKYTYSYIYSENDENDLTYFIKYNLESVQKALVDLNAYIKRKLREQKSSYRFIEAHPDLNHRQATILRDYVKGGVPFSIPELKNRYKIAYQTARLDVRRLQELGLVRAVYKKGKRVSYAVNKDALVGENGNARLF
ncbi:MAG: Fic family protein [Thermoplasmatales archaeon]|nr:Fic family protein [Thermoplasmatales archaeon]